MSDRALLSHAICRRSFLGGALLACAGLAFQSSSGIADSLDIASKGVSSIIDPMATSTSDDILLGMFFSAEKDFTNTIYTSLDGTSFEKIAVAYQDADGEGPGVAYESTYGCLGNPSIIFKEGMFFACSCWDKMDGTFRLTFGASNDLKTWARPSGAVATLEGGWPTFGKNAVAPDWFVDDDGSVYVVVCCGTMGAAHGSDWRDDEMYPYLIKATRFEVFDKSALSGDISKRFVDSFARIELGTGRRINLPSNGWLGEHNRIDASIYKEDGVYFLCIKRNGVTNEIWTNRNIEDCNGWSLVNGNVVEGSEGASLVKWGSTHYMYTDKLDGDWSAKGYGNDIERGTWWVSANRLWDPWSAPQRIVTTPMSMQRKTRHGSVIRVTDPRAKEIVWRRRAEAGYLLPIELQGDDFDQTAVAESRAAFPNGADTVVIAGQFGWPDALSAAGLAGALDCPVLVSRPSALSEHSLAEVRRLGARNAIVVGGELVVSDQVVSQLRGIGCDVTRLAGWNAVETCHSVYCYGANKRYMTYPGVNESHEGARYEEGNVRGRNIWGTDLAIVATAMSFADALSASPIAFALKAPLFLTNFVGMYDGGNRLSDDLLRDLSESGVDEVLVCGGSGVIPDTTLADVSQVVADATVVRKGGTDAIDTSLLIADYAVSRWGMHYDGAGFATAKEEFGGTDALAGAAVCGKAHSVLLLADDRTLRRFNQQAGMTTVRFFGGPAVISKDFRRRVVGAHAQWGL